MRSDLDLASRWRKSAQSWGRRAAAQIRQLDRRGVELGSDDVRRVAGYEADLFVAAMLDAADSLVDVLTVEELGDLTDQAKDLARKLNARRLNAKLANVEGRTPEEAESFRAKADELAAR